MRSLRLLAVCGLAATLTACSTSDPLSPAGPGSTPQHELIDGTMTCRSGYVVFTRSDGTQECVPEPT